MVSARPASASALLARDITACYPGGEPVLRDVSLEVPRGTLISLIGPNASGKSTLVRVLAGLHDPESGTVHIADQDLSALSRRERARQIAIVPQSLRALPDATVKRFVLGGRYAHAGANMGSRSDFEIVHAAMDRTRCGDWGDRPLATLSGGERQRVLVARAVAQDTPILLCDEPTAALDIDQQLAIYELLADLASGGRSVVTVTHDLNLASQFSATVHLLHRGEFVAEGHPERVLTPEVLQPVYGPNIHYGTLPGDPPRPLVVARRPS